MLQEDDKEENPAQENSTAAEPNQTAPRTDSKSEEKEVSPIEEDKDSRPDPFVVAEDQKVEDELDSEGFLDLTGSGRLRKKVLEEGRTNESRPERGMQVKCKVTSE